MRRSTTWGMAALTLVIVSGCGGQTGKVPKWPDPVPVKGKVSYGTEPLANAIVSFIPDGSTPGQGGSGTTNNTGEYQIKSRWVDGTMKEGAIPGKYKVRVSRMVKPDGSVWTPKPDNSEGPATSGAREEIPLEYSNPAQSKLDAEVSKTAGTFDFTIPKGKR